MVQNKRSCSINTKSTKYFQNKFCTLIICIFVVILTKNAITPFYYIIFLISITNEYNLIPKNNLCAVKHHTNQDLWLKQWKSTQIWLDIPWDRTWGTLSTATRSFITEVKFLERNGVCLCVSLPNKINLLYKSFLIYFSPV